ncbi:hypothetical protein PoB_006277200 [Plakobranchus ocellatus]|uniref:Uncharacterized protein n=1 Tax=Plakobranchus ocellatus TaxID=259542 RepID=A0AAV4CWH3_9GAST|nr:hypothetical protein PoB_006277200 [Plakobranchus ocellatus]
MCSCSTQAHIHSSCVPQISEKNEALAHQKLAAQVLADKLERLESSMDVTTTAAAAASTCSTTREIGVQSPSLPRFNRSEPMTSDADLYLYDDLFDLKAEKNSGTRPAESQVSVEVEKEKCNLDLVHELCDQDVNCDQAISEEEEDSVTPFVSADDGEEDETTKKQSSCDSEKIKS